MENTNRDTAQNAAPQHDWQDTESNAAVNDAATNNEPLSAPNRYIEEEDEQVYAMAGIDGPDPDEEDEEQDEDENEDGDDEEEAGDWGHVDPAEGNSPFPDSNAPGFPGSAV